MLHLNLICVGKLKETYWREAGAEYLKRLTPFAKVEIVELKEESFDAKSNVEIIKKREEEKLKTELKKNPDAYVIALDEHGKQFSSELFAKQLNNLAMEHSNNFVFIIGGPLGLDQSIVKSANLVLSLGAATLTHQMARVVLLEQLYRAMMIQNNRPYHY